VFCGPSQAVEHSSAPALPAAGAPQNHRRPCAGWGPCHAAAPLAV